MSRSHRRPGLSSKFAWLIVQKMPRLLGKFWIMVQWVACIIVQPAYWFNFSLDKRGTINQESLYLYNTYTHQCHRAAAAPPPSESREEGEREHDVISSAFSCQRGHVCKERFTLLNSFPCLTVKSNNSS